ncbi:hypothetical protein AJ78_05613 [Emergomyces pasteurianus Ep9510]|uniref:DUF7924 domain-containing protein n=1 Tax=Emergomyces pasteurianus Ep9510 TaxID=1447872 RepID=A0A1J9PBU4_9EURO|nr:hypothetical protein AJ78_05613 [Emergomyces pasteurianus Ep9510]
MASLPKRQHVCRGNNEPYGKHQNGQPHTLSRRITHLCNTHQADECDIEQGVLSLPTTNRSRGSLFHDHNRKRGRVGPLQLPLERFRKQRRVGHSPSVKKAEDGRRSEINSPVTHQSNKRLQTDSSVKYWILHNYQWPKPSLECNSMESFLSRPKILPLGRTKSSASLSVASESSSRVAKSSPYSDKNCELFLEIKRSFLCEHENGISYNSWIRCQQLLENTPKVPRGTRFDDGAFGSTCRRVQRKNKTGVSILITELIVPFAEDTIYSHDVKFPCFIESFNEGWDSSIPLNDVRPLPQSGQPQRFRLPRPQPGRAVGFARQSFTEARLKKLAPFVGEIGDTSFFLGTAYMYFPFMTSEVKCGKAALDTADRQNAHSMTLSVRGIVKLFKLVKREKELHREVQGFSVSHDHCSVRIYGYYPVIDGEETAYYRHVIHKFDITALNGKERWTCYRFIVSVYSDWARSHFKKLCAAIDELPEFKPE